MSNIQEKHVQNVEDFYASNVLTLKGKAADYSDEHDPFSNFRFAANAAGVTIDQVFLVLQGIKLARLRELLTSGKTPQNEPVEDTMGDGANYYALHSSYQQMKNSTDPDYLYAGVPDPPDADIPGDIDPFLQYQYAEDLEKQPIDEAPVVEVLTTAGEKLKAFLFGEKK